MSRKANRKKKPAAENKTSSPASLLGAIRAGAAPGRILRLGVTLALLAALAAAAVLLALPMPGDVPTAASRRVFVPARVTAVLSDNAGADDGSAGRRMGRQVVEVVLLGGAPTGARRSRPHDMSAESHIDGREGTRVILRLDYEEDGTPYIVSFVNYDRGLVLGGLVLVFAALLIIIGGKKGLMALLGLVFTLVCLWFLLIPLIMRGVPPIPAAIAIAALTATVSLLLLTGFTRKTLCAALGCVGGVAAAGLFAAVTPLGGFNMSEAEELVIRAADHGMTISGLLVAGILISSLGAVMDVAMSIASSCNELYELNPKLTAGQLFRSGMNIGRDAMGTMANTLILAFAGSALNMLILFRAYDYPLLQVLNSDLMAIEILQGVAGSIGIILTVPLVAALSANILKFSGARTRSKA